MKWNMFGMFNVEKFNLIDFDQNICVCCAIDTECAIREDIQKRECWLNGREVSKECGLLEDRIGIFIFKRRWC